MKSCAVPPGTCIIPSSSVSHLLVSSWCCYQIDRPDITVLVFKQLLFYLIMVPEHKSSMLAARIFSYCA